MRKLAHREGRFLKHQAGGSAEASIEAAGSLAMITSQQQLVLRISKVVAVARPGSLQILNLHPEFLGVLGVGLFLLLVQFLADSLIWRQY